MINNKILIVDDEPDICNLVSDILSETGYSVNSAFSKEEAIKIMENSGISLVITDIWMNDNEKEGFELLEWCKAYNALTPVLIMSGHGTIEYAMNAAKNGAYDFLEKPFNSDRLLFLVKKALQERDLKIKLMDSNNEWLKSNHIIGKSSKIRNIKNICIKVSKSNSRILISGPSGSGKETCARFIHSVSNRMNHPFVVAACASLSNQMVDQLLFGFNDSKNKKDTKSLFEQANNGTIYFNEICDLPNDTQAKLINVIQDQSFYKYGSNKKIKIDIRVIAGTTFDPNEAVKNGILREDLYYRLSVVPIVIPSLNSRIEDINVLINSFMEVASKIFNKNKLFFSDETYILLQSFDWKGNVRQLKNLIEWLLIMYGNEKNFQVEISHLPPEFKINKDNNNKHNYDLNLPIKDARKIFEKKYLETQLNRFKGNIAKTSTFVGMDRSALHRKIKELDIKFGK